jgi:hypothetical protein
MPLQIRNPKPGTRPKGGSPKDKSKIRNPKCASYLLAASYFPQIAEISTKTSFGNLDTSTVSRAGRMSEK